LRLRPSSGGRASPEDLVARRNEQRAVGHD
jgi:hypothetical protein